MIDWKISINCITVWFCNVFSLHFVNGFYPWLHRCVYYEVCCRTFDWSHSNTWWFLGTVSYFYPLLMTISYWGFCAFLASCSYPKWTAVHPNLFVQKTRRNYHIMIVSFPFWVRIRLLWGYWMDFLIFLKVSFDRYTSCLHFSDTWLFYSSASHNSE